jgi:hypothetical protein
MGFLKPKIKKVEATAQEKAVDQRQSRMIDEEIAEGEKRLKAVARGKLGATSLLAGTGKAKAPAAKAAKPSKVTMKPNYNLRGIGR